MHAEYPRDLKGYRGAWPDPKWPNGAKLAVQFVLNYEEGGEQSILHGDVGSETFLSEIINAVQFEGARHHSMESLYEYGSRSGVWRLLALFRDYEVPITIFAVASALERYPELVQVFKQERHEICSHGYKWINYQHVGEDEERDHLRKAMDIFTALGETPIGWYTGRTSPNTKRLVAEDGRFLYCADDYNDDLPYWESYDGKPLLIIPYTLDVNDMRFVNMHGFVQGDDFFTYLKDTFDFLYREGDTSPKMMSVGLHCRLAGRPGRAAGLKRFLEHVKQYPDIWLCTRAEIAHHWQAVHPFRRT